jgi:putative acetyltransferase
MIIRKIRKEDNPSIAQTIRTVLTEFGVNKPGTVFTDPTTDALFELFQKENSVYLIAEADGQIIGGCGIYPTEGLEKGCAELVKLYLHKDYRNRGIGKELMQRSIESVKELGYTQLYLETLPELHNAIELYRKMGFTKIDHPLGNSGHFACDLWMVLELKIGN